MTATPPVVGAHRIPTHLPRRLAVSLWDFTWYTRTGPGEPFADLDAAFAGAVDRGYNCVRICAAPFLLFGSGLDTSAVRFSGLAGPQRNQDVAAGRDFGQGIRWYDVDVPTVLDLRTHLLDFFRAARRHGVCVIVSSWEYQQSPCFAGDRSWFDALVAVPPEDRAVALAEALADLVDLLVAEGLDDVVALVELHNEVQAGRLTDVVPVGADPVVALGPSLERGVAAFAARHPAVPACANYARVPVGAMHAVPASSGVGVFHPYVYGVLDALNSAFAVREPDREFDQDAVRELLRPGAPDLLDWNPPADQRWRLEATVVGRREIYLHDWCDPAAFDRWLYDRYAVHRLQMRDTLDTWIDAAADWAATRDVPFVLGEGWVGYTPRQGRFEEGPVGAALCERAVRRASARGAWGTVVCSNAAPHHSMWDDVELQRRLTAEFLAG